MQDILETRRKNVTVKAKHRRPSMLLTTDSPQDNTLPGFELITAHRVWKFVCETTTDVIEWLHTIRGLQEVLLTHDAF